MHEEKSIAVVDRDVGYGSQDDEAILAEQGKTQQLKRTFGFWSMIGFTATMMCTYEAMLL